MTRDFFQPEFGDIHYDLTKLVKSRFYSETSIDYLKAACDLIIAADVAQEVEYKNRRQGEEL